MFRVELSLADKHKSCKFRHCTEVYILNFLQFVEDVCLKIPTTASLAWPPQPCIIRVPSNYQAPGELHAFGLASFARSYQTSARYITLIPENVLYRICLAVGNDKSNDLDTKHQRNLDILAMVDVCRSWRNIVVKFDDLFRHIAFDTSDGCTVTTSSRVLKVIETKLTKLEVSIRSKPHELLGGTRLQIMAKELVHRLSLQSDRFISFELHTHSSHLSPYFNYPAPALRFLHQDCVMTSILFASSFPNLRVLHTRVNNVIRIPPSSTFNLVELQLVNSSRTQGFSMGSVLALLRSISRLEVLHLSGFAQFCRTYGAAEPVQLAHLKSVHFVDCRLQELLPRLRFPQLDEFTSMISDFASDENTPPSEVGDADFFSPLRACPLPIIDQRPLTCIFVSTKDKGDKIKSTLRLMSGPDHKYKFVTTAIWWKCGNWENRLRKTIEGAVERIRLTSSVCLYLIHDVSHGQASYSPLLRLPQIDVLCTAGLFTPIAFKLLINSGDTTSCNILPRLKCFCFRDDLLVPSRQTRSSISLCLRYRFKGNRPLAIRCCETQGEGTCSAPPPGSR